MLFYSNINRGECLIDDRAISFFSLLQLKQKIKFWMEPQLQYRVIERFALILLCTKLIDPLKSLCYSYAANLKTQNRWKRTKWRCVCHCNVNEFTIAYAVDSLTLALLYTRKPKRPKYENSLHILCSGRRFYHEYMNSTNRCYTCCRRVSINNSNFLWWFYHLHIQLDRGDICQCTEHDIHTNREKRSLANNTSSKIDITRFGSVSISMKVGFGSSGKRIRAKREWNHKYSLLAKKCEHNDEWSLLHYA